VLKVHKRLSFPIGSMQTCHVVLYLECLIDSLSCINNKCCYLMTLLTRSPYFRHRSLRAFYKSCLVSNVCTWENADCFCPRVFDLCSSSFWRRLCGLSLFSSSWSPWGWITRLTNNMNVSTLHTCGLFSLWKERKAFLEQQCNIYLDL